jgi:hypothetical protein
MVFFHDRDPHNDDVRDGFDVLLSVDVDAYAYPFSCDTFSWERKGKRWTSCGESSVQSSVPQFSYETLILPRRRENP